MLKETIFEDMKAALKAGDKIKLSTTRLLRSEIKNAEIAKGKELTDEETIDVVVRELRRRQEAIDEYEKARREDLVAKEKAEAEVLRGYLPPALSEAELAEIIDRAIAEMSATGAGDMGKVMKAVMPKVKGRADGAKVSALVKAKLSA